jgi:hypothetical protein
VPACRRSLRGLWPAALQSRSMFLQNAAIHDHKQPRFARLLRCRFVHHSLLHPYGARFQLNRLVDDFWHEFRPPENIYDINRLWNIQQRGIRLLAENLVSLRIHGNDAVALRLHVGGNAMTGTHRIVGKPNHRYVARRAKKIGNRIGLRHAFPPEEPAEFYSSEGFLATLRKLLLRLLVLCLFVMHLGGKLAKRVRNVLIHRYSL